MGEMGEHHVRDIGEIPSTICHGSEGGFFLPLFGNQFEMDLVHPWFRALLYFLGLVYTFYGVSIISDIFVESIEVITSQEREVEITDPKSGKTRKHTVWNATVANLSLMALGTSAPEILLNVVEVRLLADPYPAHVVGHGFYSGELGPSTIVGSAAFNFFVITAIVISTIPT
ncbi:Sodium/calcium exchanger protein-domain-containing protein, partial [Pavlovales sp. CCMP2436]